MIIHATPSCNNSRNQGRVRQRLPQGILSGITLECSLLLNQFFIFKLLVLGEIS